LTLGVIVVLFVLLVWDRWPTWAVFAGALAAILTLDLAPEGDALSGFANSGVLSVVVLYVVAQGMYRTGAISLIVDRLVGVPRTERAANVRLLPITAVGSAFLNNTPIVAMLIPVIYDIGASARLAVSKIYMAVSNASILGGASTLIGTSTNLIIAGLAFAVYEEELTIFFPTRIGLPAAILGVLFLLFVGERLLGDREEGRSDEGTVAMFRADFRVGDRLVGQTLRESGLADPQGGTLASLQRDGSLTPEPSEDIELQDADVLGYSASVGTVGNLWTKMGLIAATPSTAIPGTEHAHRLAHGVVAPSNKDIGRHYGDIETSTGKIVAVSRHREDLSGPIADAIVEPGDVVLIEVPESWLAESHDEEYLLITERHGYRVQRVSKAATAGAIVGAMVLLSAFGIMSLLNAALLASIALIATGCLSFRSAWDSIDWQTYVVLAAAVGLAPAVAQSGLADVFAEALISIAGDSTLIALIAVYAGAILLTNLVTNAAAAALMFPVTVGIVTSLGTSWEPFVAILMLGCSYAFINPAGYQTSLMVMKPGGYTFSDFARVGIPLTIVVGVVAIALAPILYPL
ncbi:MAG: SLC13 family permease, partial [Acidimicrobiia bacterium]